MNDKQLCAISYGEWFPYYDLEPLNQPLSKGDDRKMIELSTEDYLIYKGLLTQMERLQYKLANLHERGLKP